MDTKRTILTRLESKLDWLRVQVEALLVMEKKMAKELDDLTAQVKANTDVEQSAVVLINGIAARIDAAIAAGGKPADFVALSSSLKTSADSLAAAVKSNTPGV